MKSGLIYRPLAYLIYRSFAYATRHTHTHTHTRTQSRQAVTTDFFTRRFFQENLLDFNYAYKAILDVFSWFTGIFFEFFLEYTGLFYMARENQRAKEKKAGSSARTTGPLA